MNNQPNDLLKERIRKARGKFAAMAATYFIGVFNDNFFKQSALIMAIVAGRPQIQGYATLVFTLPFILFAAPAGFFADRFPKRSVVIAAKLLELTAMIFGALGIYYVSWTLILVMLGIEGLQAAIFSPALNGSIPELYPRQYVIKANAIIRMISTAAILAGIAAAGFIMDKKGCLGSIPLNHILVAATVIGISAIGVLISLGVPRYPAASPNARFPWTGPIDTLRTLYEISHDSLLAVSVVANTFFWFIASLEVLVINQLGLSEFALTASATSFLIVSEMVGIVIGGLLSTKLATGQNWYRVLHPACFTMAICMLCVTSLPYIPDTIRTPLLTGTLLTMGAAAGVLMIPLESFIQVRPAAHRKGATIAAANFAAFTGILLSGPVTNLFNWLRIAPTKCFAIMGTSAMIMALWLFLVLRRENENN